jgi:hypothetical protein
MLLPPIKKIELVIAYDHTAPNPDMRRELDKRILYITYDAKVTSNNMELPNILSHFIKKMFNTDTHTQKVFINLHDSFS